MCLVLSIDNKKLFSFELQKNRHIFCSFFIFLLFFGVYSSSPIHAELIDLEPDPGFPSFCDNSIIRPEGPHGSLILQPFGPEGITVENPFPPAGPIIIKSDGLGIGSELILNGETPAYRQDDISRSIDLGENVDPTEFFPFHRDKKIILDDGTSVTIYDDYRFGQIDIVKPSVDDVVGEKLTIRHGGFGEWEVPGVYHCPPITKNAISKNCDDIRIRPEGPHGRLIIQPFGDKSLIIKNNFPPTGPIEVRAFDGGKLMKFMGDESLPNNHEDDVRSSNSIPLGPGRDGYVLFLDDQVRASLEHTQGEISVTSPGLVGNLWPQTPPQFHPGVNPLGFGMNHYLSYFEQSGIVIDEGGFGDLVVTVDPLLFKNIPVDDVHFVDCPPIPKVPLFGSCDDIRVVSEKSLTIQPFGPNSLVIKKFGPQMGDDSELHVRPYLTHSAMKFFGNDYDNAHGYKRGSVFPDFFYIAHDGTRVDIISNNELKITHPGFVQEIILTNNGFGELKIMNDANGNNINSFVNSITCPAITPIDFPIIDINPGHANKLKTDGNFHDSLIKYNDELEKDPGKINALVGKAVVLTDLEQYESANKIFIDVLRFYPNHLWAINGLALLESKQGHYENAESLYRSVLDKDDANYPYAKTDALVGLAHITINKAETDKFNGDIQNYQDKIAYAIFLLWQAEDVIINNFKLDPDPNIPNTRSQLYLSIIPPDLVNVFDQHQLALSYDIDENVDAHNGLGDYYFHIEDWKSAKQEYSTSLELASKNLDALVGMILVSLELDLIDDARSYYEDASTWYPDHTKLEPFEYLS